MSVVVIKKHCWKCYIIETFGEKAFSSYIDLYPIYEDLYTENPFDINILRNFLDKYEGYFSSTWSLLDSVEEKYSITCKLKHDWPFLWFKFKNGHYFRDNWNKHNVHLLIEEFG